VASWRAGSANHTDLGWVYVEMGSRGSGTRPNGDPAVRQLARTDIQSSNRPTQANIYSRLEGVPL